MEAHKANEANGANEKRKLTTIWQITHSFQRRETTKT